MMAAAASEVEVTGGCAAGGQHSRLPEWLLPLEFGRAGSACEWGGLGQRQRRTAQEWKADVVTLRVEWMGNREFHIITYTTVMLGVLAVGVAITQVVLKYKVDVAGANPSYFAASVGLAGVMLALLLAAMGAFAWAVRGALAARRRWTFRRGRIATAIFVFALLQLACLVAWLAATASVLGKSCGWMTEAPVILGGVQWTIQNTQLLIMLCASHSAAVFNGSWLLSRSAQERYIGSSTLVLDAPWIVHLPKLVLWAPMEAVAILTTIKVKTRMREVEDSAAAASIACPDIPDQCIPSMSLLLLLAFGSLAYLGLFLYHAFATARSLHSRPFHAVKAARILSAIQVREMVPVMVSLVLSIVLVEALRVTSCWTYVVGWLAIVPPHITATACAIALLYFFTPKAPSSKDDILQDWLEEVAWTEAGRPAALAARDAHLASSEALRAEPMFCVETAVKLLHLAGLVYALEEVDPAVSLFDEGAARELLRLEQTELVWDRGLDSKALVGWEAGGARVYVAFKGTSSGANLMTDLKLLRVVHPPPRQVWVGLRWQIVRVHQGFHEAWEHNGYSDRLISRLEGIVTAAGRKMSETTFLITGHSLGGAMAVLCARSLKSRHPGARAEVYTFGAPRVGCRAFATEYSQIVPDTWAVICGNDPVPRVPAGGGFKRVGHRVLVDSGDLIVRPNLMEMSLFTGRPVVGDHLLEAHRAAFAALVKSQFDTSKQMPGGVVGAAALAAALDLNAALVCRGLDPHALADASARPITLERLRAMRVRRRLVVAWCGWAAWCSMGACDGDVEAGPEAVQAAVVVTVRQAKEEKRGVPGCSPTEAAACAEAAAAAAVLESGGTAVAP